MHIPYAGSGPYCYANSFAMMFGANAPSIGVVEFAMVARFPFSILTAGRRKQVSTMPWPRWAGGRKCCVMTTHKPRFLR